MADHRAATARYIRTVETFPDSRWNQPRPGDKWSAAEVTQHLILSYRVSAEVLAGKATIRPRVSRFWSTALRWILLPHVLFHRSLPLRAVAPREVRPAGDTLPPQEAIEALSAAVIEAERQLQIAGGRGRSFRFDHPYFGPISPLRMLRFLTVHLDHHRAQIEEDDSLRTP